MINIFEQIFFKHFNKVPTTIETIFPDNIVKGYLFDRHNLFTYAKNKTFLDLGCGGGIITALFAKKAKETVACDISEVNIIHCNKLFKSLNIRNYTLVNANFEEVCFIGKFGTILISRVLEHINDPALLIANMCDLLEQFGVIIIVADVRPKIGAKFKEKLLRWGEKFSDMEAPHPEVHVENILSDEKSKGMYIDEGKLERLLMGEGLEIKQKFHSHFILYTVSVSLLNFLEKLLRPQKYKQEDVNISHHNERLMDPVFKLYKRIIIPIFQKLWIMNLFISTYSATVFIAQKGTQINPIESKFSK